MHAFFRHFEKGARTGHGSFLYKNGDIYCGDWVNGRREGKGMYIMWPSRARYEGEFKAGMMTKGVWRLAQDQEYEGEFKAVTEGGSVKPVGPGIWKLRCATIRGRYDAHVTPVDFAKDDPAHPPTEVKLTWTQA
jgi:hypothetical protein